jgi:hypothetical protein
MTIPRDRDAHRAHAVAQRGLAGRLARLAERWTRDFSAAVEDYSLAEGTVRRRARLRSAIEVSRQTVRLSNLPPAFHGLRVVQLTDIHHGLYLPLYAVLEAVELANRLEPDVVALTGDFVTYSRAYVEPVAHILGRLRARRGVYAVLGNHDFRVGAEHVARALRREGIEVLRNRHVLLRERGQSLVLAGVDDFWYGADLRRALHGVRPGQPVLLLSHNPKIIRRAARAGVSLVLSGHTHGGQMRFPAVDKFLGREPSGGRFRAGWDRHAATQMYVCRGIGTVVLPLRLGCPAEILHLELAAHDTFASHCRPAAEN